MEKKQVEEINENVTPNQYRRMARKIKKANKLYVRAKSGSMIKIDNISEAIYDIIIVDFLMGKSKKLYANANKNTRHYSDLSAINFKIAKQHASEFNKVLVVTGEEKSFTVMLNDYYRPLANCSLKTGLFSK